MCSFLHMYLPRQMFLTPLPPHHLPLTPHCTNPTTPPTTIPHRSVILHFTATPHPTNPNPASTAYNGTWPTLHTRPTPSTLTTPSAPRVTGTMAFSQSPYAAANT